MKRILRAILFAGMIVLAGSIVFAQTAPGGKATKAASTHSHAMMKAQDSTSSAKMGDTKGCTPHDTKHAAMAKGMKSGKDKCCCCMSGMNEMKEKCGMDKKEGMEKSKSSMKEKECSSDCRGDAKAECPEHESKNEVKK